jgi:hypothetical protein
MRNLRVLLCALGVVAVGPRADAQVLYAARGAGQPGELYTLNKATGAMITDVGPLNDVGGTNFGLTGIAFSPVTGILYGSVDRQGPPDLVIVNPATARVTVIGAFNVGATVTMTDLAFDSTGKLYGISSSGGANLYSIDVLTGAATLISAPGTVPTFTEGGSLAFNAAGVLYSSPTNTQFGKYDPTTGAYTDIANPQPRPVGGTGGSFSGMGFDATGTLYGMNLAVGGGGRLTHLVTLDPTTGAVTDVGPSITAIDAIAFQPAPVPEPGTLALLCGPVALGLFNRLRRRK